MDVIGLQGLSSVLLVLALVAGLAWLVRRGTFTALRGPGRRVAIETAVALGERRSLVIVNVEGRRLLLGLTPASVSMVIELAPGSFDAAVEAHR